MELNPSRSIDRWTAVATILTFLGQKYWNACKVAIPKIEKSLTQPRPQTGSTIKGGKVELWNGNKSSIFPPQHWLKNFEFDFTSREILFQLKVAYQDIDDVMDF